MSDSRSIDIPFIRLRAGSENEARAPRLPRSAVTTTDNYLVNVELSRDEAESRPHARHPVTQHSP